ncbi:hypothetical protein ABZ078_38455 [Streptomyces sp. NPDC006385]|uniref:hypothetical protein n=1 Tax=Streptomyces sp. NPDC006385 TaxID=3156761 RepID=UPI0033AF782F
MAAAASLLVGIGVAAWLVFGAPQGWEGGMRWLRHGLALASVGAIGLAARLMFPDTGKGTSEAESD